MSECQVLLAEWRMSVFKEVLLVVFFDDKMSTRADAERNRVIHDLEEARRCNA